MTVQATYSLFTKFYDAYVGDYAQDLSLYLALSSSAQAPVLEIGCGSGRVLLPLLRAGHVVTGVDISDEMLELAEKKIRENNLMQRCTLLNHNFADSPLLQEYGLALVTFYTFNYLLSRDQQEFFLIHIAQSLNPGSIIALHLFYPNVLLHPETNKVWIDKGQYQIHGESIHLTDFRQMLDEHIEERIQAFQYESGRREEICTLRRYVRQTEIQSLLISAGFEEPVLIDDFQLSSQSPLRPDIETASELVIMAKKK